MQQNILLAVVKILAICVFAFFLGLNFLATQNLEEKVNHARDSIEGLSEGVAETSRQTKQNRQSLDEILAALESGELRAGSAGTAAPGDAPPSMDATFTLISGKKVYPRNPGWTVLCDKNANDDPKRDLPEDQIDWNAVLPDVLAGEPKGLNWYSDDRTVTVSTIARYCTNMLAERKTTNLQEWRADLAERIEESPDRTQYMIYLRKGVRWHRPALDLTEYPWLKGSFEVTARDVKYTYDIIRDPNTVSPLKIYYAEMVSADVVDDHTLRVTWKRPNFYARASTLEIRPYPEHIMACDQSGERYDEASVGAAFNNHWFSKSICGNGPYRFAEYRKGESIRMVRNENYFGPRPTCREYHFKFVKDPEARLAKFWNKEVFTISPSAEQYRRIILEEGERAVFKYDNFGKPAPKDWEFTYSIWRRPVYGGFAWNQRREVLKDRRVRKAMTYALNRFAVVDKLFYGLGEVIPIGESVFSFYFNKNLKVLPFDLDKARKELDAAGWRDGDGDGIREKTINGEKRDLEFELIISASSPIQTAIVQMYKEDLRRVGVKLNQLPVDSALWAQKNSERDFDGLIIFWYAGIDSDPKQLWDSKSADISGSNNYTGFKDEEADAIFERLTETFDYEARSKLMHRWYEIQYREQPYTWIWSVHSPILVNADWRVPEPKLDAPYVDRRLVFRWKNRK
jgi:peptide/nickel transport system substrate-binding protein